MCRITPAPAFSRAGLKMTMLARLHRKLNFFPCTGWSGSPKRILPTTRCWFKHLIHVKIHLNFSERLPLLFHSFLFYEEYSLNSVANTTGLQWLWEYGRFVRCFKKIYKLTLRLYQQSEHNTDLVCTSNVVRSPPPPSSLSQQFRKTTRATLSFIPGVMPRFRSSHYPPRFHSSSSSLLTAPTLLCSNSCACVLTKWPTKYSLLQYVCLCSGTSVWLHLTFDWQWIRLISESDINLIVIWLFTVLLLRPYSKFNQYQFSIVCCVKGRKRWTAESKWYSEISLPHLLL